MTKEACGNMALGVGVLIFATPTIPTRAAQCIAALAESLCQRCAATSAIMSSNWEIW